MGLSYRRTYRPNMAGVPRRPDFNSVVLRVLDLTAEVVARQAP